MRITPAAAAAAVGVMPRLLTVMTGQCQRSGFYLICASVMVTHRSDSEIMEALIPGRVVADILEQQLIDRFKLLLPKPKVPHNGLTVCPGMIVLGVLCKAFCSIVQLLHATPTTAGATLPKPRHCTSCAAPSQYLLSMESSTLECESSSMIPELIVFGTAAGHLNDELHLIV